MWDRVNPAMDGLNSMLLLLQGELFTVKVSAHESKFRLKKANGYWKQSTGISLLCMTFNKSRSGEQCDLAVTQFFISVLLVVVTNQDWTEIHTFLWAGLVCCALRCGLWLNVPSYTIWSLGELWKGVSLAHPIEHVNAEHPSRSPSKTCRPTGWRQWC